MFRLPLHKAAAGPVLLLAVLVGQAAAHPTETKFRLDAPCAEVHGTALIPHEHEAMPCVVILGGTLSQDRNGRMFDATAPPRDALLRLAEALQAGGYASVRYDRVGYGLSKPTAAWKGTYTDEAAVAAAVIQRARGDKQFSRVIVLGESAGGYVACLAAKNGTQADGYLFLGALCSPAEEMYEYNFGRLAKYAASSPERTAWASGRLRHQVGLGRHYGGMFAAAAEGKTEFATDDEGYAFKIGGLVRRREELTMPPDEMFRHIKAPTLAIAGAKDRNVPPEHAARIAEILTKAGNKDATSQLLDGVDHSFQRVAAEEDLQIRERYELTSFKRPYDAKLYHALLDWLYKRFPTPAEGHPERVEMIAARETAKPVQNVSTVRAVERTEIDPVTDVSPERIQLAPGIEIIADITDARKTAGVETLEGRIGPLLLGEGSQAHFIEMPAGMYVEEHPHSSESIIYTVRGRWVLCSAGRRQLMQPGTLFRFGRNIPTGYEVPFGEPATILIFKGDRHMKEEREFIDYLKGMAKRLEAEHKDGVPYLLRELPADHAARIFAQQVNPQFEAK